jgi:hypothetical protein
VPEVRDDAQLLRAGFASRVRAGRDLGGRQGAPRRADPGDPGRAAAVADSLAPSEEVALEATCNAHAIAKLLEGRVARVVISNPQKTRAIAEAKVNTDEVGVPPVSSTLIAGPSGLAMSMPSTPHIRLSSAPRGPAAQKERPVDPPLSKELGCSPQPLRNWARRLDVDEGRAGGLTSGEREKLRRLRREVRTLTEEREIQCSAGKS